MSFPIAAGFASSRKPVLSSTEAGAPREQRAPQKQETGIIPGYDCLLSRISSGICENATQLHRLDLQRLGRRVEAECELQEMLANLKDRMTRKAAARTRSAWAEGSVEVAV